MLPPRPGLSPPQRCEPIAHSSQGLGFRAPRQSYVRQEQQQAATDKAADKPRSRASGKQQKQLLGPKPRILPLKENTPGFTEKVREETARAKRVRSNSYGSPASSLLLVAWRLKKNGAAPQQGRFNRASASEPCFRPEVEKRPLKHLRLQGPQLVEKTLADPPNPTSLKENKATTQAGSAVFFDSARVLLSVV